MLSTLPQHIAFIVDGNRRWAQAQGKPVIEGHAFVANKTLDDIVFYCLKQNIPYVTFWAFSTENWKRGNVFVNSLFNLLEKVVTKDIDKYNQAGVRLNVIGDLTKIHSNLAQVISKRVEQSKHNTKLTVTIALNYGGRDEIVRSIKRMIEVGHYTLERITQLTEGDFAQYLDTSDLPDPDLIIRTGGEQRLSGFLPWQSQYAELYFTKTLMPDFTIKEFEKALVDFNQRTRRFGK